MKKNGIIIFAGFIFTVLLMSGCSTMGGAVSGAVAGAKEGAKKDVQSVQKTDEWIRKNLW